MNEIVYNTKYEYVKNVEYVLKYIVVILRIVFLV